MGRDTLKVIIRRPLVLWYVGLMILVYQVIDRINPISSLLSGVFSFGETDVLKSIISFLQFITSSTIWPITLGSILFAVVIGGIVGGLVLSGYMEVLNHAVNRKQKVPREFVQGIKKNFKTFSILSAKMLGATVFLLLFLAVASVPAIIATKSAASNQWNIILAAVVIDLLTFIVIFFSLMFFRIYLLLWFPAACFHKKKPFIIGKRLADRTFWRMLSRLAVFDIVFIVFTYLISLLGLGILAFVSNLIFHTVFFTVLIIFIFLTFKKQMDQL